MSTIMLLDDGSEVGCAECLAKPPFGRVRLWKKFLFFDGVLVRCLLAMFVVRNLGLTHIFGPRKTPTELQRSVDGTEQTHVGT